MNKRLTIKNHQQEHRLFIRRCVVSIIIVLFFALLLLARLSYLQVIQHKTYSTLSQKNLLEVLPIVPNRGLIYDRNGVLLAKNIPAFNLAIIPAGVKNMNQTIAALEKILPISKDDIRQFKRNLRQHHRYEAIPIKMNLDESELAKFYVNHYRFPGVVVKSQMFRTYPYAEDLSNVLGYVGRINAKEMSRLDPINYSGTNYIGKTGIEKYYERLLHGKVGFKEAEIDATGHIVRIIRRVLPRPGNNIYLTIDSRLQLFAEKALGDNNGAIVVIQPSTGQILAMVSKPSFDPNLFVNGISKANYQKLLHDKNHPLFNRAIRGQYAPGSTVKPFYSIAGLNSGSITTNTKFYDPGWFQLPNTTHVYHDWKRGGHGWVNVTEAIMVSCDTFFYNLAVRLGISKMDETLSQFGFGKKTQIDMPQELPGIVPSPSWKRKNTNHHWYTGDTVLTGIGQGFMLATPLQLAAATSIIAERGAKYQPHLLLKLQMPNGKNHLIPTIERPPLTLKNPNDWNIVINGMHQVIANPMGTAVGFGRHPSYEAAAKTGTAQVYGKQRDEELSRLNIPKRLRNNHLFIVFAPINNPQIVIAVVIEHSAYADRVARRVMDFYFHHCAQQDKAVSHDPPS